MPWLKEGEYYAAMTHQCGPGSNLVDYLGDPALKPTRFFTNSLCIADVLNKIRCPGHEHHAQIIGRPQGVSAALGTWTRELADSIIDGLLQQRLVDQVHGTVIAILPAEPSMQASADVLFKGGENQTDPTAWDQVPHLLRVAIRKVHEGHAHAPYKESLVRYLRQGGAHPRAVAAARLFVCDMCESTGRHANKPVAAMPKYRYFNEAITMDFMVMPDLEKNNHCILVIVDMATDFTVCKHVSQSSRPTAAGAAEAFDEAWISWAGPPTHGIILDLDSAFMGSFEKLINDLGIPQTLAAPEAHWQMGKIERKIGYLKEMSTTVFKDLQIRDAAGVRIAVAKLAWACNSLTTTRGFSPSQWVLGTSQRLPASLGDPDNDQAVVSRVVQGTSFWHRLQLEQVCSEAFFKAANSDTLRRTILSRLRPQPGPFEQGDLLMYWRSHNLKQNLHDQWHGPARCLGKDAHGYWLIHNRIPILAAPTLLRKATAQ